MKSTITLLLLATSYALSSSITPEMVIKKESQLNLIFSKESILQKEIRPSREKREARECRFCLRKMTQTRDIRTVRLDREIFYFNSVENKKLAIIQ